MSQSAKSPSGSPRSLVRGFWDPVLYEQRRFSYALAISAIGAVVGAVVGLRTTFTAGLLSALFFALLAVAIEIRGAVVGTARFFSESIEVLLLIEQDKLVRTRGRELLRCYASLLDGARDATFLEKGQDALQRCASEMRNLTAGRMSVDKDRGLLYLRERLADETLRYCHAVSNYLIWSDQAGRNYNTLNIERARAGVKIERVFLEDTTLAELAAERRQTLDAQVSAGIRVFVVRRSDVTDKTLIHGFAIFDRTLYVSLDKARDAPDQPVKDDTWQVEMSDDPHDVRTALEDFETLKALAEEVPRPSAVDTG